MVPAGRLFGLKVRVRVEGTVSWPTPVPSLPVPVKASTSPSEAEPAGSAGAEPEMTPLTLIVTGCVAAADGTTSALNVVVRPGIAAPVIVPPVVGDTTPLPSTVVGSVPERGLKSAGIAFDSPARGFTGAIPTSAQPCPS